MKKEEILRELSRIMQLCDQGAKQHLPKNKTQAMKTNGKIEAYSHLWSELAILMSKVHSTK